MAAGLSTRDVLWNACREKTCCRATRVVLTGSDVARLSTAFELAPDQFACHAPTADDDPAGFKLVPGGPRFELLLRKNGAIGPAGAPCVFLVATNDGHAACGAGSVRPAVCQAFPATIEDDRLRVATGTCTCRRWTSLDLSAGERAQAQVAADAQRAHEKQVWAWNAGLAASAKPRTLADYFRYLLAACT